MFCDEDSSSGTAKEQGIKVQCLLPENCPKPESNRRPLHYECHHPHNPPQKTILNRLVLCELQVYPYCSLLSTTVTFRSLL